MHVITYTGVYEAPVLKVPVRMIRSLKTQPIVTLLPLPSAVKKENRRCVVLEKADTVIRATMTKPISFEDIREGKLPHYSDVAIRRL